MHGEKIMCKARKGFEKDVRFRFSWLTLATVSLLATLVFSSRLTLAQDPNQQVFHSPEEASAALFTAAQQTDNRALLAILGPAGKDLISSGDPAEDRKSRDSFVAKYKQSIVLRKNGTAS
jgi:Protein of unknown function (DUF2950)